MHAKLMDGLPCIAIQVRHPKEGRFNPHCVDPRFPLSALPQKDGGPRLLVCLLGSTPCKGDYKVFCIGGVLSLERTLEWKLRMNHQFSSCIAKQGLLHIQKIKSNTCLLHTLTHPLILYMHTISILFKPK
jgi:hypothetical protein